MHEFRITVSATGEYTEDQLREFIRFELGQGSLSNDSPFISEDSGTEITSIDID